MKVGFTNTEKTSLNDDLSLKYKFDDDGAWNQTEKHNKEATNGGKTFSGWDGRDPVRLYGNNAWLPNNEFGGEKKANFYRIADLNKVINQTLVKSADKNGGVAADTPLPTDIAYGTLNHVQFGRVTANTSSLRDADASYGVDGLQFADFAESASDRITTKGDKFGTDFYFARGNNPTSADDFKALPSAPIAYHGNALVFGLNDEFHGGKSADPKNHKALPHSFGKDAPKGAVQTLLGGRGNFVYAQFNPAKGTVDGSIYNVWLVGTYKPHWTTVGYINGTDPTSEQWKFYPADANENDGFSNDKTKLTDFDPQTSIKDVFPVKDDLIQFEGKVVGNTVKGDAMNYNAQKGKFAGAFFGKNAEELSGVITSNTKDYGKADDAPHWGAVFGAQTVKDPATGKTLPAVLPSLGGSSTSWLHEDKR